MSNWPIGKRILLFFTKRVLHWAIARIADKYQRARLLRASAFAHGVNSFDRGSRFSIFENAPVGQQPGATSLNLFSTTNENIFACRRELHEKCEPFQ